MARVRSRLLAVAALALVLAALGATGRTETLTEQWLAAARAFNAAVQLGLSCAPEYTEAGLRFAPVTGVAKQLVENATIAVTKNPCFSSGEEYCSWNLKFMQGKELRVMTNMQFLKFSFLLLFESCAHFLDHTCLDHWVKIAIEKFRGVRTFHPTENALIRHLYASTMETRAFPLDGSLFEQFHAVSVLKESRSIDERLAKEVDGVSNQFLLQSIMCSKTILNGEFAVRRMYSHLFPTDDERNDHFLLDPARAVHSISRAKRGASASVSLPSISYNVNLIEDDPRPLIALLIPTKVKRLGSIRKEPLMRRMIRSFGRTAESSLFRYVILLGVDRGDPLAGKAEYVAKWTPWADVEVVELSTAAYGWLSAVWNMLALRAKYLDAAHVFVLNDDVKMLSPHWTSSLTGALAKTGGYGIAGPIDLSNPRLLTQVFLPMKHVEILGYVYPPHLRNWFVDDWATLLYEPFQAVHIVTETVVENLIRLKDTKPEHNTTLSTAGENREGALGRKTLGNETSTQSRYTACTSSLVLPGLLARDRARITESSIMETLPLDAQTSSSIRYPLEFRLGKTADAGDVRSAVKLFHRTKTADRVLCAFLALNGHTDRINALHYVKRVVYVSIFSPQNCNDILMSVYVAKRLRNLFSPLRNLYPDETSHLYRSTLRKLAVARARGLCSAFPLPPQGALVYHDPTPSLRGKRKESLIGLGKDGKFFVTESEVKYRGRREVESVVKDTCGQLFASHRHACLPLENGHRMLQQLRNIRIGEAKV